MQKIIDIILSIISQINSFNNKDFLGIEYPPQRIPSIKKIWKLLPFVLK